jgi:hypothetical protein
MLKITGPSFVATAARKTLKLYITATTLRKLERSRNSLRRKWLRRMGAQKRLQANKSKETNHTSLSLQKSLKKKL